MTLYQDFLRKCCWVEVLLTQWQMKGQVRAAVYPGTPGCHRGL